MTSGFMRRRFPSLVSVFLCASCFNVWRYHEALLANFSYDGAVRLDAEAAQKSHRVAEELQSVSSRYYIYDDDIISQSHRIQGFRRRRGDLEVVYDQVMTDIEGERNILRALEKHPLRTMNPKEAEIFIIPTPITELLAYGCHWEKCTWYDEAFDALVKHPLFQQHQGHNHVLISQSFSLFNKRYSAYMPALSRNYRLLENVTVANDFDPFGCVELHDQLSKDPLRHNDFRTLYQEETPVTNAFSVGLGFSRSFPVRLASYQRFRSSKSFLFYHPRQVAFSYGSDKFRDVLLDATFTGSLPPSSVGYDVVQTNITSSKFCLVVREDTPHSYSLSEAVRAGCIPVIVSDDYQAYGGPFKSSISTHDFAIYINETSLLADPVGELGKLQDLSQGLIEKKLEELSIAQRILLPDHRRSLFVQAFVREAISSQANALPQVEGRLSIQVLHDNVTISGKHFKYRYPSSLTATRAASKDNGPIVILGILSKPENFNERHSIRETWASEHDENSIFFLLGGPWEGSLIDEFETYGDIVWIDMDESYYNITYKVQAFLHAVNTHVDSYDYIMKADDDSYVFVDDVKQHLSNNRPEYWGQCFPGKTKPIRHRASQWYISEDMYPDEFYPIYAAGVGYALSRNFTACAVSHLERLKFMPFEDTATGILAEFCGVPCDNSGWEGYWKKGHGFEISHKVQSSGEMVKKHWKVLKSRGMGEWSTNKPVKESDYIYRNEWTAPIVMESHKLIFFNVAKVGSSSFKRLFRRMMGYDDWYELMPHDPATNGLKRLDQYSTSKATELMNSPEYTRAIFVRDPKDRILSAFLNKVVRDEYDKTTSCCSSDTCRAKFRTFPGFLDIIRHCDNQKCCEDDHWMAQSRRMDDKFHSNLNFVGHLESAHADAKRLLERIGAWEEFGLSGWGPHRNESFMESKYDEHKTDAAEHRAEYYTPEVERVVEEMYASDYSLFKLPK